MKLVTSRDNPFVKELIKLAGSSRERTKARLALLDGTHLLAAYLDSGALPKHILVNRAALKDNEVEALLKRATGVPMTQLDDKLFAELSGLKTLTGILTLIDIPRSSVPAETSRFCLLLEDIQDPGNLGAMLRSAAAAGCDAVFLSKACADVWSPRVLRAAMGGHFCLSLHENADLLGVVSLLSAKPYAAALKAERSLYQCTFAESVAFAIGNEGAGLSAALLGECVPFHIPMPGKVESLNAAAATAICLFEAVRQSAV